MPTNIEIKARAQDPIRQRGLAAALADGPAEVLYQHDTFFNVPHGRLKLRVFGGEREGGSRGELIYYRRPDVPGPRASDYRVSPTDDPASLLRVLSDALGACGEVRKRRTLYLAGQTRIHFDEVEGLGEFLELEVVLRHGQSAEEGRAVAEDLMRRLDVRPQNLTPHAYADLRGR